MTDARIAELLELCGRAASAAYGRGEDFISVTKAWKGIAEEAIAALPEALRALVEARKVAEYVIQHNDDLQNSPGHFSELTTLARTALGEEPSAGEKENK